MRWNTDLTPHNARAYILVRKAALIPPGVIPAFLYFWIEPVVRGGGCGTTASESRAALAALDDDHAVVGGVGKAAVLAGCRLKGRLVGPLQRASRHDASTVLSSSRLLRSRSALGRKRGAQRDELHRWPAISRRSVPKTDRSPLPKSRYSSFAPSSGITRASKAKRLSRFWVLSLCTPSARSDTSSYLSRLRISSGPGPCPRGPAHR